MLNMFDLFWGRTLTEFIKVCVNSVTARDGADEPSFQEGGPLVYQTPVTSQVILRHESHL